MDLSSTLGIVQSDDVVGAVHDSTETRESRVRAVNLMLAANGLASAGGDTSGDDGFLAHTAAAMLDSYREQSRQLLEYRCPVDRRIETFLQTHLADLGLSGRATAFGNARAGAARHRPRIVAAGRRR